MQLSDVNPFMRFAELQPSVVSSASFVCSYDYRLFYIIDGTAELILEHDKIDLKAGMLVYFRPGTPYYFHGKVKIIVLNFDMTREHSDEKKPLPPSKNVKSFDSALIVENEPPRELENLIAIEGAFELKDRMQECLVHYTYPSSFSDAQTSAIIKQILCYVVSNSGAETPAVNELVRKITLYIQQNYDGETGNGAISAELGYHSFYLNRVYKKNTGMTIHQAVIAERIRIAKRLLRETALSVKQIADEVGFIDSSQLCTSFRKYTGTSPKEYRKKKQSVVRANNGT